MAAGGYLGLSADGREAVAWLLNEESRWRASAATL
jgi:hypothetical protein